MLYRIKTKKYGLFFFFLFLSSPTFIFIFMPICKVGRSVGPVDTRSDSCRGTRPPTHPTCLSMPPLLLRVIPAITCCLGPPLPPTTVNALFPVCKRLARNRAISSCSAEVPHQLSTRLPKVSIYESSDSHSLVCPGWLLSTLGASVTDGCP